MPIFRVALAQINTTVGDLTGNVEKIIQFIDVARQNDVDLVAFPEMSIPGYPPEDLLFKPSFLSDNKAALQTVVQAAKDIAVLVGFADSSSNGETYNAAALAHESKLRGTYHKMYLPNYGVFDENRYFKRGTVCPVYTINGTNIGVNICEDIWHRIGPVNVQWESGADFIVNISASPYYVGKNAQRENLIADRAADNKLCIAYVNAIGGQDELVFDGASLIVDHFGNVIARGRQFEEELVIADIDIDAVRKTRIASGKTTAPDPQNLTDIGIPVQVHISAYKKSYKSALPRSKQPLPLTPKHEIYKALILGTRDYVQKSGFSKVLIGLSGGIDSALTACLASEALGAENVLGISMPSRYTSSNSTSDAKSLAEHLGIELWTIPIEPAHTAYSDMLAAHFNNTKPNVAEENIQARIRGNTLMAISNKFNWLVLTTGNKSEIAMGFSTLYGDSAGGFAVLRDVPKTLVYEIATWINQRKGSTGLIPDSILHKPPTAELRPGQTDQDILPPYSLLDVLVELYVEENRSYKDIVQLGFDAGTVKQVITTIDRNEYKRRQAPPGIKITPRAFGKDWRFPIINKYNEF